MQQATKRAHLVDAIRGLLIIYIVFYHLIYDLVSFYGMNLPFFGSNWFQSLRVASVMALLYISGLVSECTRNGWRRFVKLALCAAVITAASFVFLPDTPIYFGVIHLYATCALIYLAVGNYLKTPAAWIGAALCLILFMALYNLPDGFLRLGNLYLRMPRAPYELRFLAPIGFPPPGFASADYYPVLPWAFMFLSGAFFAKDLKNGTMNEILYDKTRFPLLERIGRRTLVIYMVHQPILLGILYVLFNLL